MLSFRSLSDLELFLKSKIFKHFELKIYQKIYINFYWDQAASKSVDPQIRGKKISTHKNMLSLCEMQNKNGLVLQLTYRTKMTEEIFFGDLTKRIPNPGFINEKIVAGLTKKIKHENRHLTNLTQKSDRVDVSLFQFYRVGDNTNLFLHNKSSNENSNQDRGHFNESFNCFENSIIHTSRTFFQNGFSNSQLRRPTESTGLLNFQGISQIIKGDLSIGQKNQADKQADAPKAPHVETSRNRKEQSKSPKSAKKRGAAVNPDLFRDPIQMLYDKIDMLPKK